jgi:hypothetical protein
MPYLVFRSEPSFRVVPAQLNGLAPGPQQVLCEGHVFAVHALNVDCFLKDFEVDYGNAPDDSQDDHNFGRQRVAAQSVAVRTNVLGDPSHENVFFDSRVLMEIGDDGGFGNPYQGSAQVVFILEHS